MNQESKIIIVGGPTATGKTKAAIEIAKKFNGELVNADSRQIYKLMDIGTNKEYPKDIPIHLLDLVNPDERFSVYEYQQAAFKTIEEILSRGKLPILVGGTGLYIDSIIKGYDLTETEIEISEKRSDLENKNIGELQKILFLKNPKAFDSLNESDKGNSRRLVRQIEKAEAGSLAEEVQDESKAQAKLPAYETLFLYPDYDWEDLKLKIVNRVEQMFKVGLVDETKSILAKGYKTSDPGLKIMGYKQVVEFLDGRISLENSIELVKFAHIHYAKRQRTWFEGKGRNYKLIQFKSNEETQKLVFNFLR